MAARALDVRRRPHFIVGDRMVERHFGDDGTGKPMGIIVRSR
jgi:hypothetical protein